MKNIFKEFSLVFVLIFLTQPCFANNVNFQATVDSKRITMDSALRLSLTITNADAAAASLPEIDGFEYEQAYHPASMASLALCANQVDDGALQPTTFEVLDEMGNPHAGILLIPTPRS